MPDPHILIAVVDDDERVRTSLGQLLASAGYDTRLLASGTEFVDGGWATKIDCLVCDVAMPAMDGLEVMRLAREAAPGLAVILITGQCDIARQLPSAALMNCRLFSKPFDSQELLAAVADAVRDAPGG